MSTFSIPQYDYLQAVKRELALPWDEIARRSGIAPRALKTYRTPLSSKDHRAMPAPALIQLDRLLQSRLRKQRKSIL